MSDKKVKFAVVRIHEEQRMIELFKLLVENGFPEVSFVATLAHANQKDDQESSNNQEDASGVSSSSTTAAAATATAHVSSSTVPAAAPAPVVSTTTSQDSQHLPQPLPKLQTSTSSQQSAQQKKPLTHYHPRHDQHLYMGTLKAEQVPSFSSDLMQRAIERETMEADNRRLEEQTWAHASNHDPTSAGPSGIGHLGMTARGTARVAPFTPRTKGWQRHMLTEAMVSGIPKGALLKELCERSQVTRAQAMRFFRTHRKGDPGIRTSRRLNEPDHTA